MSIQEIEFAETISPDSTITHQRLDMFPEPATMDRPQVDTRSTIPSRTNDWGIASLFSRQNTSFALAQCNLNLLRATYFLTALQAFQAAHLSILFASIGRVLLEQQRYRFTIMRSLTTCDAFFNTTLKTLRPFLPRENIVIHPEVRAHMKNDEHLQKVIDISVSESANVLKDEDNYLLEIFEESDIEVPRWTESIVRIRIERGSLDKMKIWEKLEERVRSKIEEIRKQLPPKKRKKIDAINERLSIRVEEAFLRDV